MRKLYLSHPGRLHRLQTLSPLHGPIRFARVDRVLAIHPASQAMLIALHKNARTTLAVPAEIAASEEPASVLAQRFGITEQTVYTLLLPLDDLLAVTPRESAPLSLRR